MTFILPGNQTSLKQEVNGLTQENWNQSYKKLAGLDAKRGLVYLPKFSNGFSTSLGEYFKLQGMTLPFDAWQANFENMLNSNTSISKIIHNSRIQLDETGVEAAAVTVIMYPLPSATLPEVDFIFNANRPFLYLIHDLNTGLVLFVGSLINPLDKGE